MCGRGRSSARAIASGTELVHHVGGADALREVAARVVHLQEVPAPSVVPRAARGATRRRRTTRRRRPRLRAPPAGGRRRRGRRRSCDRTARGGPSDDCRGRPRSARRRARSPATGCAPPIANTGYGMRSSHGTPSARGTCGPASQCQKPPGNSGGLRQAVLAITWQSSPSSGSITSRIRGCTIARWHAALRLSIS